MTSRELASSKERYAGQIMTVRGPIPPELFGMALPHEHVLVDFIGADKTGPDRYDPDDVYRVMLPYLKEAREQGWTGFVDCTPAYLARDPVVLRRLSEAADLHTLTNTGYYKEPFLPPHAFTDTVDGLADRWVREFEDGIPGTGIRPGFIKIAVNPGPLAPIQQKIVRAAARAHRLTGLPVASHTVAGVAAMEELDLVEAEGMDPGRFIVVHADGEPDREFHHRIARRGAWVEFDGIGWRPIDEHVELIAAFLEQNGPDRLLISHDAGWYNVGEPNGGNQKPFTPIFANLFPALRDRGVKEEVLRQLITTNPARAYTIE
jgi:predicted metal-dependent phosphotriesterase family hydrolase